jgi:hypothetical protein
MVRPSILCDHNWHVPSDVNGDLRMQRPPDELQFLGMLECTICELPAIKVRANDGREWIGVFGSRFAATTGIHQPQQWIPSPVVELAGARS